uniref:Uncharacterized protein n=1 Tax=Panagrolaimus sp. ES5 TaxID=591445 RepID=A0AC34G1B1_9BILA
MKFRAVYKWGEYQAMKKQNEINNEAFDLRAAIKMELTEILPLLEFCRMSKKFLAEFVVGNGITSADNIAKIHKVYVTMKNNGKLIAGSFDDEFGVFDNFIRINGQNSWIRLMTHGTRTLIIDDKLLETPPNPSTVYKKSVTSGTQWYLCIKGNGNLALKHRFALFKEDYLLAEMKLQTPDFDINQLDFDVVEDSFYLEHQHITFVKARRAQFNIN